MPGVLRQVTPCLNARPERGRTWPSKPGGRAKASPVGTGNREPGRSVSVTCDGCGAGVAAVVSYVSNEPEFTPPVIYSNETRAKLVFLVEARPSAENAARLRPGQPVSVTLQ